MYYYLWPTIFLNILQVEDTLKMLSNYFVKQRLEFGLYGLYPKYRLHIKPISVFLCLLSHTYIVTTLHAGPGGFQDDGKEERKPRLLLIKGNISIHK